MIEIAIPGDRDYQLRYLVLDYNGTLAVDGYLIKGVKRRLCTLSPKIEIHVVTADTFGRAERGLKKIPCELSLLPFMDQARRKAEYIERLGREQVVCIGNGRNDLEMMKRAGLGIAVIQAEGACALSLKAADIVCCSINHALDLLCKPKRIIAVKRK